MASDREESTASDLERNLRKNCWKFCWSRRVGAHLCQLQSSKLVRK